MGAAGVEELDAKVGVDGVDEPFAGAEKPAEGEDPAAAVST
jgi:hypothetical protein